MEHHGVVARGLESVAFLRQDVQQDRPADLFHHLECLPQFEQVVPVDGADVPESHFFEQHSAVQKPFQSVFELADCLA